jgi:hypothetical protein
MPPVSIEDESSFEEANPEHPEAASNRFVRIDAAEYLYRLVRLLNGHTLGEVDEVTDFFRGVARTKAVAIEQLVRNDLHEALFDRDAAVRLTIVEILAVLARPESIPFLERLSDSEDEGVLIPQAIPKALDCCRNAKACDIRNWLSDVPGTLNCEVVDCWLALNGRDSQVHRRNLVRAVFAAIEGCLSVLKMQLLDECHGGGFRLSRAEAALLEEEEAYDVTDSSVKSTPVLCTDRKEHPIRVHDVRASPRCLIAPGLLRPRLAGVGQSRSRPQPHHPPQSVRRPVGLGWRNKVG